MPRIEPAFSNGMGDADNWCVPSELAQMYGVSTVTIMNKVYRDTRVIFRSTPAGYIINIPSYISAYGKPLKTLGELYNGK